jgi:uncharacterized protein (DUF983 family)
MTEIINSVPDQGAAQREMGAALWRGFIGRCPHCGKGRMFRAYLKVVDRC